MVSGSSIFSPSSIDVTLPIPKKGMATRAAMNCTARKTTSTINALNIKAEKGFRSLNCVKGLPVMI